MYKCSECDQVFPTQKTANNHYLSHHVQLMCKHCKKSFKNSNTLRSHEHVCLKKNTDKNLSEQKQDNKAAGINKKFSKECDHCGKPFSSKSGFNKHIKQHRMADEHAHKELLSTDAEQDSKVNISDPVEEVLYIVEPNDNGDIITYPVDGIKVLVNSE